MKYENIIKEIEEFHKINWWNINKKYLEKIIPDKNIEYNLSKIMVLYAIATSKWNTTILFNWHWSKQNWAFKKNQINDLNTDLKPNFKSINYEEIWDALIESWNIKNINLIWATCLAYDYLQNLFLYIEKMWISEKPYVSISTANKWESGRLWSWKKIWDFLLNAFFEVAEEWKAIKVDHFFKIEWKIWKKEDPALFIWWQKQYQKWNIQNNEINIKDWQKQAEEMEELSYLSKNDKIEQIV
jgi:hypothetical protein